MKKLIAIALCAVMALPFASCGNGTKSTPSSGGLTGNVQIANPFTDCKSLDEAVELAGFEITVPDEVDGYDAPNFRAMKDSMIEIIFTNDNGEIRIRKAAGSEDASGDYTAYAEVFNTTVDGREVTMKGEDGKVKLASWVSGDYTYSVSIQAGVSSESAAELIQSIQ
ncbi:MAG: hypothetical protein ACOX64_07425 [Candidatus Merdivicinus sp.]|jgi:hypothetical protein